MLLIKLHHYYSVAREAYASERARGKTIRRNRIETEFLPAVLEVLETPVSPVGRALMWAIMLLFITVVIWSVAGRVDVVAIAPGKIVAAGRSKVVQPLEAGIVKTIFVEDGQHVRQGQVLIELDATQVVADVSKTITARVDATLASLRARSLIDAQLSGQLGRLPRLADATEGRQQESQSLADSAFAEYRMKITALNAELSKRMQERQTADQKISGLMQTAPMAHALADDYRSLQAESYVSRHAYLEKEQLRIQQEQELATQQSYARELGDLIRLQKLNIATAVAQFKREQAYALNQAEEQLAQLRGEELKSAQRQKQTQLVAPVDGTIQQLAIHTTGGVVTPAQELLVLVPDAGGLEIDALLLNQDVGTVRLGQEAQIKLDAFPFTRYGTVPGQVTSISHDAVKDDKLGLVYPMRIKLLKTTIAYYGTRANFSPGMAASVEIRTDRRRIIEYLLTPLARYQHDALRER